MLLHPLDYRDQTKLSFTGELVKVVRYGEVVKVVRCGEVVKVVTCGFVMRILRFLGFLKEFDISTGLWKKFLFHFVCVKRMRIYNGN